MSKEEETQMGVRLCALTQVRKMTYKVKREENTLLPNPSQGKQAKTSLIGQSGSLEPGFKLQ